MTDKSTSSQTSAMLDSPAAPAHGEAHGHGDAHLAHHFDTPQQQYQSAKVGMWVFLGTELLMFGGLFCAYAVYRHSHPEVFEYAHRALDTNLGAINTAVLITSSFTMAWGVRAAQLGQKKLLSILLILTLFGGVGFMCIKSIEYTTKWKHHLFPGSENRFSVEYKGADKPGSPGFEDIGHEADHGAAGKSAAGEHGALPATTAAAHSDSSAPAGESHGASPAVEGHATSPANTANTTTATAPGASASAPVAKADPSQFYDPNADYRTGGDAARIKPNFADVSGLAPTQQAHPSLTYDELTQLDRQRVVTFFSIYFIMTGLHGVHVLVGMGLIFWVLLRSLKGEFSGKYFTPVDLVGLYWHLVDLIWIFLFPLLYLIH